MRKEFIRICRRAVERGMQLSSGGNISVRLGDGRFLAKPSGISMSDLTEENLIVVDEEGKVLEGNRKPSKEFPTHLALYHARPGIGAVTHYHPPHATAYAVAEKTPELLTVHARRTFGMLPLVPPAAEGSPELSRSLIELLEKMPESKAALLAGHGVLTWSGSLAESQNLAELVEETAWVAFLVRQINA